MQSNLEEWLRTLQLSVSRGYILQDPSLYILSRYPRIKSVSLDANTTLNMYQQGRQSTVQLPDRHVATVPLRPRAMTQRGPMVTETLVEKLRQVESEQLYARLALYEALSVFSD